jgi:hypothetical protein
MWGTKAEQAGHKGGPVAAAHEGGQPGGPRGVGHNESARTIPILTISSSVSHFLKNAHNHETLDNCFQGSCPGLPYFYLTLACDNF